MLSSCILEYVKALGPVVALLVGPWLALRVYYRQKQYETTKQRYLEGCLDVISSHLQATLGTVSHNYARVLALCKAYRDYGEHFDPSELSKGFRELDNSKFLQTEHFRLRTLIDSDVAWSFFQSALAHAASADATFTREIPDALRILSKSPEGIRDRNADVEKMFSDAQALHREGFAYSTLQSELNALAATLEQENLGMSEVRSFSKRKDVQASVSRLKAAYEKLSSAEPSAA